MQLVRDDTKCRFLLIKGQELPFSITYHLHHHLSSSPKLAERIAHSLHPPPAPPLLCLLTWTEAGSGTFLMETLRAWTRSAANRLPPGFLNTSTHPQHLCISASVTKACRCCLTERMRAQKQNTKLHHRMIKCCSKHKKKSVWNFRWVEMK